MIGKTFVICAMKEGSVFIAEKPDRIVALDHAKKVVAHEDVICAWTMIVGADMKLECADVVQKTKVLQ